jgi:hypothetical protein
VGAVVFACGIAGGHWDPDWWEVSPIPGREEIDPALAESPDRIVVAGTDASLAAVVLRLLRKDRLDIPVGYWPLDRKASTVARLWRLPADALRFAEEGEPVPIPLVRDDSGGVLVGLGRVGPVRGEAYCDDQLALRGAARAIEVTPDPAGVAGRVVRGPLRRSEVYRGRAFQLGCEETTVAHDGITHPRPVQRWTWYRHTEDLRAVSLPR